jgi:SAM-dependent methyltransferase
MHLDDPTAVLREMARVVRHGGRLVVADPIWASVQIDHPDHEALEQLLHVSNAPRRNSYMGLELNRRMANAGLVERVIEIVPVCVRDHSDTQAYGLDLTAAADVLVAERRLSADRASALLADLQGASDDGTYFCWAGFCLARATVACSTGGIL